MYIKMKKSLLGLVATVCLVLLMNTTYAQKVKLGVRIAPSFEWVNPGDEDMESDGTNLGIGYGLVVDYPIAGSDNYFLSSGLFLKHNSGGNVEYDYNDGVFQQNATYKYSATYLSIPISLKLKTNEFGRFTYFCTLGIDNAFRIGVSAKREIGKNETKLSSSDAKDQYNFFREGLILGAGCEYMISGNTKAFASLNFNNGFTDVLGDFDIAGQKHNKEGRQRAVELHFGILF